MIARGPSRPWPSPPTARPWPSASSPAGWRTARAPRRGLRRGTQEDARRCRRRPGDPRASNLVTALAFRPDGRALAYAGGDDQAVFLKDLRDANAPPKALAGTGGSLWEVGFSKDGRAVAYSRRRDDAPDPPSTFLGFDLKGRRVLELARKDVVRAVRKVGDLAVRPTAIDAMEVVDGRGVARPLVLSPTDGRWWDYGFLPPTADHPSTAVAVAAEAGVVIFAAIPEGGAFRRVRLLAGHAGPVLALAPSPDGKWLATGSSDQTLRLWPLARRDALAPFGATFAPGPEGRLTATAIAPLGFAEAMGLERGDVVEKLFVAGAPRDPKEVRTAPDAAPRRPASSSSCAGAGGLSSWGPPSATGHSFPSSRARTASGSSGCPRDSTTPRSSATASSSAGIATARNPAEGSTSGRRPTRSPSTGTRRNCEGPPCSTP